MPNILFANFAHSQLAAGLAPGDTALSVTTTHGARFPSPTVGQYFYLVLENASLAREIVKVNSRAGDVMTVQRAQDGTTALSWNVGDVVSLRMVAAALSDAMAEAAGASFALLSGAVFSGPVEVPSGGTGNQVRRASEVVQLVGGAARMPNWTTAGRPASPSLGDTGLNTTLGVNETWNNTHWAPDGWIELGTVDTSSGTGGIIGSIPSWVNEMSLRFEGVSLSVNDDIRIRLGTSGGIVTTGYLGVSQYVNMVSGTVGSTRANGIFVEAGATVVVSGDLTLRRRGNVWSYQGALGDHGVSGVALASGRIDLGAALTQVEVAAPTGAFDAGAVYLMGRK